MPGQRIRWGLLSTARINERVIPAIRASERSELLAVASRSQEKADQYAREWQIPRAYGRYDDLLADPDVDVVYIPLPNSLHAEWSIKSAQAGKHILCEKPMALTPDEVDRMVDAARRHGVILQEAAMYRFHPHTLKVQEWAAQEAIGDLRVIRGTFGFTLMHEGDVRLDPDLGGGALWDVGSYPVSFARMLAGANPVEVVGWQVVSDTGVDLTFAGQMRFATGILAQFSCSFQTVPHWEAELIGSRGRIYLNHPWQNRIGQPGQVRMQRGGGAQTVTFGDSTDHLQAETLTDEGSNAYIYEIESMVASMLDGKPTVISLEDSRGNVATLAALYTAAREKRVVML